jgi:hypothetical protein
MFGMFPVDPYLQMGPDAFFGSPPARGDGSPSCDAWLDEQWRFSLSPAVRGQFPPAFGVARPLDTTTCPHAVRPSADNLASALGLEQPILGQTTLSSDGASAPMSPPSFCSAFSVYKHVAPARNLAWPSHPSALSLEQSALRQTPRSSDGASAPISPPSFCSAFSACKHVASAAPLPVASAPLYPSPYSHATATSATAVGSALPRVGLFEHSTCTPPASLHPAHGGPRFAAKRVCKGLSHPGVRPMKPKTLSFGSSPAAHTSASYPPAAHTSASYPSASYTPDSYPSAAHTSASYPSASYTPDSYPPASYTPASTAASYASTAASYTPFSTASSTAHGVLSSHAGTELKCIDHLRRQVLGLINARFMTYTSDTTGLSDAKTAWEQSIERVADCIHNAFNPATDTSGETHSVFQKVWTLWGPACAEHYKAFSGSALFEAKPGIQLETVLLAWGGSAVEGFGDIAVVRSAYHRIVCLALVFTRVYFETPYDAVRLCVSGWFEYCIGIPMSVFLGMRGGEFQTLVYKTTLDHRRLGGLYK